VTQPAGKAPITIRLEVLIPTELGPGVQVGFETPKRSQDRALTVLHPDSGGQTLAQPTGSGAGYVMCARGVVGGAQYVSARVYSSTFDTSTLTNQPDNSNSALLVTMYVANLNIWQIDNLPVEGPLGQKQLVVWSQEDGNYYRHPTITFQAVQGTYTYCYTYGLTPSFRHPHRPEQAQTPDRWLLQVAGCSNWTCQNCSCLNGEWLLTRDRGASLRWYHTLNQSFSDPRKRSYWRLTFHEDSGFWYLDCVENLEQAPSTWISYRRHESAWDAGGPNVLYLVTDSGYCHVPDAVTLVPA
jgi:hypothetical protein